MDRSIKIAVACTIALTLLLSRAGMGQFEAVEAIEAAAQLGDANQPLVTTKEAAVDPVATTEPFVLRLTDGDYAAGKLAESPAGRGIVWKSPAFQEALRFPYERLNAIVSSSPEAAAAELPAKYRLELNGGDVLFGDLVGLDQDKLVLAESDSRLP